MGGPGGGVKERGRESAWDQGGSTLFLVVNGQYSTRWSRTHFFEFLSYFFGVLKFVIFQKKKVPEGWKKGGAVRVLRTPVCSGLVFIFSCSILLVSHCDPFSKQSLDYKIPNFCRHIWQRYWNQASRGEIQGGTWWAYFLWIFFQKQTSLVSSVMVCWWFRRTMTSGSSPTFQFIRILLP